MISKEQQEGLLAPFPAEEVEWRVGQAGLGKNGPWVKALAYLTARAVMGRMDAVFGVGGWSHSLQALQLGSQGAILCRIEAGGAVHEDVCEVSDIEPVKGAASGALKRAAVHFGVGRYLYYLDEGWGVVREGGRFRHFGKDKKSGETLSFSWDPPELPDWALPRPAAESRPAPTPEPAEPILVVPPGLPEGYPLDSFRDLVEGRNPKKVAELRKIEGKKVAELAKLGIDWTASSTTAYAAEIGSNILAMAAEIERTKK